MVKVYLVTKVFLFFLITKSLVEAYLDHRNKKHIIANRNQVPEKFADQINLEDHQKAADYSVTKINVGQFFHIVEFLLLLLWTVGGGLHALDNLAHYISALWGLNPLSMGVLFFGLFLVISMLLSIPQSIYSTFVIEERFGFNKTTPKTFIIDRLKGITLGTIIGVPILYGILFIMESLGSLWWVYAWAFLTTIQFIIIWAYPTFIAPIFNKFSEMEDGEVKEKVLGLLQRTDFVSNGLFVMDASMRSSHGNAYFTGFGKNKRIVFFDTLIKTLDPAEVEAVLAHELGHFKRKHIMKGLIKSVVMSFIGFSVLGLLEKWAPFYTGHGMKVVSNHGALMLFMLVSGVYTFFLTPISAWTSRKYEFEADDFASQNAEASKLISALVKLYKDNASTLTPDPLYSSFYHSHPPALERVAYLESRPTRA